MSSNGFDEARVQIRGHRLMAIVESEALGEDPVDSDLLEDLRLALNSRVAMRDALMVARAREDADDLADRQEMYGLTTRTVETALTALVDYRNDEGAGR